MTNLIANYNINPKTYVSTFATPTVYQLHAIGTVIDSDLALLILQLFKGPLMRVGYLMVYPLISLSPGLVWEKGVITIDTD